KLVPWIATAASAGNLWVHFKDAVDFCEHMIDEGEHAHAVQLATLLFDPTRSESEVHHGYWYWEGLRKVVPPLAQHASSQFLPLMCDWLYRTVHAKYPDLEPPHDLSYAWRPAIEEHEQNRSHDSAGILT